MEADTKEMNHQPTRQGTAGPPDWKLRDAALYYGSLQPGEGASL
jgi:hypothetical protein